MKKILTTFVLLISGLIFIGCGKKEAAETVRYGEKYVEAVSPSAIERLSPVTISFVYEPKIPLEQGLKLDPAQKGKWEVQDKTATFIPEKPYKANSKFTLTADCNKLFATGNAEDVYTQNFMVMLPEYAVKFNEVLYNEASKTYVVGGTVTTDIPVTEKTISKTLNAKLSKHNKEVKWEQGSRDTVWNFSISDIQSLDKTQSLKIGWNGRKLGLSRLQDKLMAGFKQINFPKASDFSIIDINTDSRNSILVSFSKTVDLAQDIASFVRAYTFNNKIGGSYNTSVRGNVVSIFSDNNFEDVSSISLSSGIKSSDMLALASDTSVSLQTNWDKPEIRFKDSNVILPTSQGTVMVVETKNLTGAIIQVYEIYNQNISSFLQENELDETSQLYKVGEPVWEKKVSFDWNDSMQNKFVSRGLDLSELVKKYPDGMFHIRVTFRKDQIRYNCTANHKSFADLPMPPDNIEPYNIPYQRSNWDWWYERNSNYRDYWTYRNDPCHPAFYLPSWNSKNLIKKNVLVSDIGIMAKKDVNNKLYVTAADLKTAGPVAGADVSLVSYIGKELAKGKTDKNGTVVFDDCSNAYYVTAAYNRQTSYLKLSYGSNLSVSHFEIGGVKAENGVKGFIYGERGVWRPGDDIYLTFVLQDLEKTLPEDIPVSFELFDAMGRSVETRVLTEGLNGFYAIKTKTNKDAVTGNWLAAVSIGSKKWTKSLKIENIVPNKLSVELEIPGEYLKSYENSFILKGAWLNGAEIPGYDAEVSVAFTQAVTGFKGFEQYNFTDVTAEMESSREVIWNGKLGSDSSAEFDCRLNAGSDLPGLLKANFVSKIFEPAGGFSIQNKSFIYSPYSEYVGLKLPEGDEQRNMLLTDMEHTAQVAFVDEDGNAVEGEYSLDWTISKLEWKWWWEKDAYTSATYVQSNHYEKVASGVVHVRDGKGSFPFQVNYPSWGRYLVEVSNGKFGHKASQIVYIDWPGWAGRAQEDGSGSASMLPLTAAKKSYMAGETAEISFTANDKARALVTVEKSGEVIAQQWIEAKEGTNVVKIDLTEEMLPNVYVHLTLLQPHLQTQNSLPIRLYGVIPVAVDSEKTRLKPVITTPDSFEPNKKAVVSVSEASGKPMTYTIAVVDEGLLGITNYHSPDMRNEFYKKEASLLESYDLYRYVMSAWSGKLETILAIGGSEDIMNNSEKDLNRFIPVVKFFGPFQLKAGEKKATSFVMPSYVGAVRTMVLAGYQGAYGTAEKTTKVTSDLMIQSSLPRTLGTNETISVPVTVFNGEAKEKTVAVTLKATGAVSFSEERNITLKANENQTLLFNVSTQKDGTAVFDAIAKAGGRQVLQSNNIQVESRGIPVTYKKAFAIKGGKKDTVSVVTPSEKSSTKLTAELSVYPPVNLSDRLGYLIAYPHGCIEQITSGAFPQLFVPDFEKLSPEDTEKVKQNIASVFERYSGYQTSSGAFSYWPSGATPHAWGTSYALHFMTEAKKAGYTVPQPVYDNALNWLEESANTWTSSYSEGEGIQAYRLFVLSLAGKANIGAMNRLANYNLDNTSLMLLCMAYDKCGMKGPAKTAFNKIGLSAEKYHSLADDFASSTREKAMYVMAGKLMGANVEDIALDISNTLSSEEWMSTQEVAWSLYALMPYYSQTYSKGNNFLNYIVNSGSDSLVPLDKNTVETLELTPDFEAKNQKVEIANKGKSTLYGIVTASGKSEAGKEIAQNNGLTLKIAGLSGRSKLSIGDTLKIRVEVSNTSGKDLKNLALTLPLGTCFEYSNERLSEDSMASSSFTYQDVKDDAVYTYFDLRKNKKSVFEFTITAAYSGSCTIPAIHVEAMYDNSIQAVFPGIEVLVK